MALTPFTEALGTRQGRLQPEGVTPPEGSWAYCLGSDKEGYFFWLEPGDYSQISQDVDLTGINIVRFRARLRTGELTIGREWEASILVDGAKQAAMILGESRTRDRADMGANVSKLAGVHTVSFRLELV